MNKISTTPSKSFEHIFPEASTPSTLHVSSQKPQIPYLSCDNFSILLSTSVWFILTRNLTAGWQNKSENVKN